MKTVYYLDRFEDEPSKKIKKAVVIKETTHFIELDKGESEGIGRRSRTKKTGYWHETTFDTWDKARDHMVRHICISIKSADRLIRESEKKLAKYRAMKAPIK
jgi:hypothetical protein